MLRSRATRCARCARNAPAPSCCCRAALRDPLLGAAGAQLARHSALPARRAPKRGCKQVQCPPSPLLPLPSLTHTRPPQRHLKSGLLATVAAAATSQVRTAGHGGRLLDYTSQLACCIAALSQARVAQPTPRPHRQGRLHPAVPCAAARALSHTRARHTAHSGGTTNQPCSARRAACTPPPHTPGSSSTKRHNPPRAAG